MSTITLNNISLYFNDKTCFEDFSTVIHAYSKILIIGNNGAGKSTLLEIIQGLKSPTSGTVSYKGSVTFGYVPQTVTDYPSLSGGQRFNKALSQALSSQPDVLLLDEPTNHLDANNKKSLIKMLSSFRGTVVMVSHDPEIMQLDFDEIWDIAQGTVTIFKGDYDSYQQLSTQKEQQLITQRARLHKEKRTLLKAKQKEVERSAASRAANRDERDKSLLGAMKERGAHTAGKKGKKFAQIDETIRTELDASFVHKKITASFSLNTQKLSSAKAIISVTDGTCGYQEPLLKDISLQVRPTEHIALLGDNGSGKSTLLKALLRTPSVVTSGQWVIPPKSEIGYLDQHYATLHPQETVMQALERVAPEKNDHEIRLLLHSFLFIKPEQWNKRVSYLSGGEKARLSLAQIAAAHYYVLLLDEITNNVDMDTKAHIIEVLKEYPGAMIIVSHDQAFLDAIAIDRTYVVEDSTLKLL
jgi:ATPase subunit of ABC transporter with duplicated ATPase domains